MSGPAAVIFDLDGVLVDSEELGGPLNGYSCSDLTWRNSSRPKRPSSRP